MNKTTTIDRTFIKAFRSEAEEALRKIAGEYGIGLKIGNGSFTPKNRHAKTMLIRKPGIFPQLSVHSAGSGRSAAMKH